MRILLFGLLVAARCFAGTEPRTTPGGYPHAGKISGGELAVEFHGRAVPTPDGGIIIGDFLVVEVALFPPRGVKAEIYSGHFRLKVDGRPEILPSAPGSVGMAMMGLENRKGFEMGGAVGPAVVVVDRPRTEPRFPGDPSPGGRPRTPEQPRSPDLDPLGRDQQPKESEIDVVRRLALDEGSDLGVRSGLLYFHWKPKLSKAKSVVLTYDGPAGKAQFKLK